MRPFFFGDSKAPLLGLHHPPARAPRGHAVVLCHPFGQEYLRAHRALVILAERLAGLGFDVLRFDAFGCGDSAGDEREGTLRRWTLDAEAAAEEAEALCGSPRVALVGMRLGAVVAARAQSRRGSADPVVLWDPVLDGPAYLEELRADHETWMREHARARPQTPRDPDQRLGFAWPEGLRAEIATLGEPALPVRNHGYLLVSTRGSEAAETVSSLPGAEVAPVPGPPVWRRDEGDGMSSALVPVEAVDRIAAWLSRPWR